MQVKLKSGRVIEHVSCTIPLERDNLLDQIAGIRFSDRLPPSVWEKWIGPILPFFNATRQLERTGHHWIVPTLYQANLIHALVVMCRSASQDEQYNGPFPVPETPVDPLVHLFRLYENDRKVLYQTEKLLFSNSNHGWQATGNMMAQQKLSIEKLSLAKLVSDLTQVKDKVDACWRNGIRVGYLP